MRKVVLITGCSSGIGRATALRFAEEGWCVYASARRLDSLRELAAPGLVPLALDVDDDASRREAVSRVLSEAGRLDALVNNAGYGLMGPLAALMPERLREQMETNVIAPMELARLALTAPGGMLERRSGRVVNVGSVVSYAPTPFSGAYCASKAALRALSDVLRLELLPFGIQVVQVEPGPIRSGFAAAARTAAHRTLGELGPYDYLRPYVEKRIGASQRHAAPAEDAAAAIYRAAAAARPPAHITVTGQARGMKAVKALLPDRATDAVLARAFGLDRPAPR